MNKLRVALIFPIVFLLFIASAFAQAPEKMSYQAVIRDAANKLVINQPIGIQISILQGSVTGNPVYTETQNPTTNANGLLTLEIGAGTLVNGNFATIDWTNGPFYIKTETDPTGGETYTISGTSQLLSVPYALHAKTVENITETDPEFSNSPANDITSSGSGEVITQAERTKLNNIQEGAETNVQPDWNQTDITADDYIRNKFDAQSLSNQIDNVNNIHDMDRDTEILVEEKPDEDIIHFHLAGLEKWAMLGSRLEPKYTGFSVFIGEDAGKNDDLTDNQNTFIGYMSGYSNTTGFNNSANGTKTLCLNTSGDSNTANGTEALYFNTTGSGNSAHGNSALFSNKSGSWNTAFGANALYYNSKGYNNAANGTLSLFLNNLGYNNTANGSQSLFSNTNGNNNTATGFQTLYSNSTGMNNSATGTQAGFLNSLGSGNIFIGYQAGYAETGSNKLYIENSNSTEPLIYGDFEKDSVRINGALVVTKDVDFQSSGSFPKITVRGNGDISGEFVALFEQTAGNNADGIKIKLGKASANNGLPSFDLGIVQSEIDQIKNLINCSYSGNKLTLLGQIVAEGLEVDVKTIGGLTVGVGNLVIGFINAQLNLPLKAPNVKIFPEVTAFPGFHLGMPVGIPDINIAKVEIGPYHLPSFTMFPKIPDISLSALNIPEIKIDNLEFWGIPNICFTDVVSDPLNNQNEFIQFADNSDVRMGAIRAQSVHDWVSDYLNPIFMLSLRGAITSTLDKKHAQYHFKNKINEAVTSYMKIGVEYSSGNGDYAEWLERVNPDEVITTGDIVAVKGGKITKDLTSAEQVMAVSNHPIVLGNVPPEGKNSLGNNIAFMGQIPVKIMGPVTTGDYIVGNSKIPGYGKAVNPEDMTIEDFKMAVGRAWETNPNSGPMVVNTVIGVHNSAFINILKRYEQKIKETENRMELVESKIDKLTGLMSNVNKTN